MPVRSIAKVEGSLRRCSRLPQGYSFAVPSPCTWSTMQNSRHYHSDTHIHQKTPPDGAFADDCAKLAHTRSACAVSAERTPEGSASVELLAIADWNEL